MSALSAIWRKSKSSRIPRTQSPVPAPQQGPHDKFPSSPHQGFTSEPVTFDTVPPVPSGLNFDHLETELADYTDRDILFLLRYGWPINYEGPSCLLCVCHNQKGATAFPGHIDHFLRKEVEAASVIGPFKSSPFDIETMVSPLNTVPKKNPAVRRIIVKLSFPKHNHRESVNGGTSQEYYLADLIHLFWQLGEPCWVQGAWLLLVHVQSQSGLQAAPSEPRRSVPSGLPMERGLVQWCSLNDGSALSGVPVPTGNQCNHLYCED